MIQKVQKPITIFVDPPKKKLDDKASQTEKSQNGSEAYNMLVSGSQIKKYNLNWTLCTIISLDYNSNKRILSDRNDPNLEMRLRKGYTYEHVEFSRCSLCFNETVTQQHNKSRNMYGFQQWTFIWTKCQGLNCSEYI